MTWSYDPTKLGETDSDGKLTPAAKLAGVRFLVGDTDTEDQLVQDEEIMYVVGQWFEREGSLEWCASIVADNIANVYAREVNYSADGVSISFGAIGDKFRALAAALRAQHVRLMMGGGPDAGGITTGEERDPTTNPFSFGTQMHDNIEAGRQDFGNGPGPYYIAEEMPSV